MKPAPLFLAASLIANVALVALYLKHSPAPAGAPAAAGHVSAADARTATAARDEALRAALESGDVAALRAAGVSPETARDLALGRAFARIAEKARTARTADPRWWRQRDTTAAAREQLLQLRREVSDAMVAAFGEDLSSLSGTGSLAFLPSEKRDALRRITQDYDEMMAKFSAGGLQLASDREKLRLLRAERDRDIAALLTPEERLAYELRTSPSAAAVRARYGDGIETEEDFRKLYALQKAFDEKFPADSLAGKVTPETLRQRAEAQRQLQDEIRATLGDEKYAALRRAADTDLRTVEALVSRLNLPATTTDQIAAARETFATESQRINADSALNPPQRRAQLQDLGNRAKADLSRALGAEAADAYAQRSPWVSMLQGGMAFSTTPPSNSPGALMPAGQSVFPVMPADGATPGGARQMVFTGGTAVDTPAAGGSDLFFSGPAAPVVRETTQVMTFSTSSSNEAAPGGAPVERRVVVPAPPPAPAPAPKP